MNKKNQKKLSESELKILEESKELEALKDFTKEQLISTIKKAVDKDKSFKQELVDLIDKNESPNHSKLWGIRRLTELKKTIVASYGVLTQNRNKADFENENNYSEYSSLWGEAEEIISKFNEYGGGDEDDEEIVYDNLNKIVEIFQQEKLDEKTKIEFINNCFECYFWGNSGFDDLLRDGAFDVCNSEENWLLVIEKLRKSNSSYDQERIMDIYKDKLNDDDSYLKFRMGKLYYGMDYLDLVDYYIKKKNIEKAVKIAKEGIEKGEGRIIDLIEFLLKFYIKNKDYENSLKYYIQSFNEDPSFEEYKKIKQFCKKEDFKKVSKKLYELINDGRSREVKAEIDFYNEDYQLVFNYVKERELDFFYDGTLKNWAQKLEPHFPEEILSIYLNKVMRILEHKLSKEYPIAEYYIDRIRKIYLEIIHNEKEWGSLMLLLKEKSIKLPSFQKVLQNFKEKK